MTPISEKPPPPPPPSPEAEDDELLDTGQEEVFSRAEVELGRTEHRSEAGSHKEQRPG